MSLLLIEGFDHYTKSSGPTWQTECSGKWSLSGRATATIETGRAGVGGAMDLGSMSRFNGNSTNPYVISKVLQTTSDTLVIGLALLAPALPPEDRVIWRLQDKLGNPIGTLVMATDGFIHYYLNEWASSGSVAVSSSPFPINSWTYLEVEVVISDSVGEVEFWFDGFTRGRTTSIDTHFTGSTIGDSYTLRFGHMGVTAFDNGNQAAIPNALYDDLYVLDDQGAAPWNAALGNMKVYLLTPTADGSANDMPTVFPASPTDHFEKVDDGAAPDEASTYIEGDANGDQELFEMSDFPVNAPANVYAVQVVARARKVAEFGPGAARLLAEQNGTIGSSPAKPVSNDWSYYAHHIFETNPDTAAQWTPTEVDDMEAGFENVSP